MAKFICINPVFMGLRGNITATDEHGHSETLRFRETSWGTKYFGLGEAKKRNYETNPLSLDEKASRNAFKTASAQRSQILLNSTLRAAWVEHFKTAKAAGTTSAKTLGGFIMNKAISGSVDEQGNLVG